MIKSIKYIEIFTTAIAMTATVIIVSKAFLALPVSAPILYGVALVAAFLGAYLRSLRKRLEEKK